MSPMRCIQSPPCALACSPQHLPTGHVQKDVGMTGGGEGSAHPDQRLYFGRLGTAFLRLRVTLFTVYFLQDLQLLRLPLNTKHQLPPQSPWGVFLYFTSAM